MDLFFASLISFLAVFHESTVAGLRFYADEPDWKVTADFVQFGINMWNVLNVRTTCKGTS